MRGSGRVLAILNATLAAWVASCSLITKDDLSGGSALDAGGVPDAQVSGETAAPADGGGPGDSAPPHESGDAGGEVGT